MRRPEVKESGRGGVTGTLKFRERLWLYPEEDGGQGGREQRREVVALLRLLQQHFEVLFFNYN